MTQYELQTEDFAFDGPLGCQGASIEKIGKDHFRVTPGHAPEHPEWANKVNLTISNHARNHRLRLDVDFSGGSSMPFNEYSYSWSYDAENWRPVHWEKNEPDSPAGDTLLFPIFERDTVYVGHQVPMSYETMVHLLNNFAQNRDAGLVKIGESLGGRPLLRLRATSNESSIPLEQRPVLYFANQHPGEHNAQWRMIGMINWLLSGDTTADSFLRNHAAHFLIMMSPDAPSNGWYRVNAEGVDMNRSYNPKGSSPEAQTHEACVAQRDLENIAETRPLRMVWGHHTWAGIVDPLIVPAESTESNYGPWQNLRDMILAADLKGRMKPMRQHGPSSYEGSWTGGPHQQFGVTAVLCEGAGGHYLKEECLQAGGALMEGLSYYCTGEMP